MPRTQKQEPTSKSAITAPDAPPPLAAQMRRDSEAAREALGSFGLTPESYAQVIERAVAVGAELRERGAAHAAARLDRLIARVNAVLEAPSSDLAARGQAYLALLDTMLVQSLAHEADSPKSLARLDGESQRLDAGDPGASLALLTVAGMCAEMGARVTPPPEGPILVEWQKWRFGLVSAGSPDAGSIVPRVAASVNTLKQHRMPGLVVLDLAQPACPEQRPIRVAHPQAGASELRERLDRLLNDARRPLIEACDRDHAIGVVGTAFMALHIVSANQMAFITAYRFMPLVEAGDPREAKLAAFRRAFGDL